MPISPRSDRETFTVEVDEVRRIVGSLDFGSYAIWSRYVCISSRDGEQKIQTSLAHKSVDGFAA
jgi:hypothetical protein